MNEAIRILGDRIANLTLKEAKELSDYLDQCDGLQGCGVTADLQPPDGSLGEHAITLVEAGK